MPHLQIDQTWNGLPAGPDEAVRVAVSRDASRLRVQVDAAYHGDPAPAGPAGRWHGLWGFEVVELFLVGPDEQYLEFEMGPHGHYLAYALSGVRRVKNEAVPVLFEATIEGDRWCGAAALDVCWIPTPLRRWNAFAIHGTGKARRYLAAHPVPGERPDFHRIDRFPAVPDLRE